MAYAAGVDVGSTQTKAVVINEEGVIVGRALVDTGANVIQAAQDAFDTALREHKLSEQEIEYVIGTGYGRYRVTFGNDQVTEISCHARGAVHLFPDTRTVVDMGGQDTKAILVNELGEIVDFCMNDKCAAGTGRFLGAASAALDIPLNDLGDVALKGEHPVKISTTCTVFAESEVINHLSMGTPPGDIMQGAIESLTTRTVQLMRRVKAEPEYTLVGGILRFEAMAEAVQKSLDHPVNVPPDGHCQYVSALGAAILGQLRLTVRESAEAATAPA